MAKIDDVTRGVWIAIEHLVLTTDNPSAAADICRAAGISRVVAYQLSKDSGYRVREMRKFAREELK